MWRQRKSPLGVPWKVDQNRVDVTTGTPLVSIGKALTNMDSITQRMSLLDSGNQETGFAPPKLAARRVPTPGGTTFKPRHFL